MKVLIAAGGTGGHVYPALAVAQELKRKDPNIQVIFVGTKTGFEAKIIPEHDFPLEFIDVEGIQGKPLKQKIKSIMKLPGAFAATWRLVRHHQPSAVFGIGGYVSGMLLIIAAIWGIPSAILEANVVAGFTNKFLSKFSDKIYLAFEESKKFFPVEKSVYSGNPIRNEILDVIPPTFTDKNKTIFIFGGSQGARRINLGVMEMIQSDPDYWKQFSFIHQTGPTGMNEVQSVYQKFGIHADVRQYFDKIMDAYDKSDFVIARAGSSVLEIAAVGRPSILIPYPHAAGHQLHNAQVMVDKGAAYLLKDADCNGNNLAKLLQQSFESPTVLRDMSEAALHFRNEDASSVIADQFIEWGKK